MSFDRNQLPRHLEAAERNFQAPASLEEAEQMLDVLVARKGEIEARLACHPKKPVGRTTEGELKEWRDQRGKAVDALFYNAAELRHMKAFIKAERRKRAAKPLVDAGIDPGDPVSLIRAARASIRALGARLEDGLTAEEKALCAALDQFLINGRLS